MLDALAPTDPRERTRTIDNAVNQRCLPMPALPVMKSSCRRPSVAVSLPLRVAVPSVLLRPSNVWVTFQGTYLVNPDCAGVMTLHVSPLGSTVDLDFVIDDDGNELRAIVTRAGVVETRVYQKQVSRRRED